MKSLNEYKVSSIPLEAFQMYETSEGDTISVPRFKPKKTTHRLFKDWTVGKDFGYDQRLIFDAIKWGMILEIVYEKDEVETKRTIQPMVLGRNKDTEELIRAFHLKGNSKSLGKSTTKVWRLFKPNNIKEMRFTGSFFRTTEDNYNPNDTAMKGGIIVSANIDQILATQTKLINEIKMLNTYDKYVYIK